MNQAARKLYEKMQQEIGVEWNLNRLNQSRAEECFRIAENYWEILKQQVRNHDFENETIEIDFFKYIKPMFLAEIEFYNLVIFSAVFLPDEGDKNQLVFFWKRQLRRLEDFRRDYKTLLEYYESGKKDKDREYFLRYFSEEESYSSLHSHYDNDVYARTRYDGLIARYQALKKFHAYVSTQVDQVFV